MTPDEPRSPQLQTSISWGGGKPPIFGIEKFTGKAFREVTFLEMSWPVQTSSVQFGKQRSLGLAGEEGPG